MPFHDVTPVWTAYRSSGIHHVSRQKPSAWPERVLPHCVQGCSLSSRSSSPCLEPRHRHLSP